MTREMTEKEAQIYELIKKTNDFLLKESPEESTTGDTINIISGLLVNVIICIYKHDKKEDIIEISKEVLKNVTGTVLENVEANYELMEKNDAK
jgi:riboflavin transporter FmnP